MGVYMTSSNIVEKKIFRISNLVLLVLKIHMNACLIRFNELIRNYNLKVTDAIQLFLGWRVNL